MTNKMDLAFFMFPTRSVMKGSSSMVRWMGKESIIGRR